MRPWVHDLVKSIRSRSNPTGAEPDAVAELALWAATADGVLDTREVEDLARVLAELPGLDGFTVERAQLLVADLAEKYTSEDAIAERILALTMNLRGLDARRCCFQLAVWSAARDGTFSEEEASFIESLQEALELSDDDADALLHATIATD